MMKTFPINKAFTLIEPGPVVLVTTHDGKKNNIMTISWTMVTDFKPIFAITTGSWNHSYNALVNSKECVISIPSIAFIDQVIGIGTCSGRNLNKFEKFGLTPLKGQYVKAPLIKECLANIECKVIDIIEKHNILILEGLAAFFDDTCNEKRTFHAVGDGTFIADGLQFDRKEMMRSKLPDGI